MDMTGTHSAGSVQKPTLQQCLAVGTQQQLHASSILSWVDSKTLGHQGTTACKQASESCRCGSAC